MRRILLIVSVTVLTTIHPLASDTLFNLGYNVQSFPSLDLKLYGIGPVWTFVPAGERGFYGQLAPSFTLSGAVNGYPKVSFSQIDLFGGGFNFTLGFGRKIPAGTMGLLIGGGLVGDLYTLRDEYYGEYAYLITGGVGGGIHVYFEVPQSTLMLNLGANASWRPAGVWGVSEYPPEFEFTPDNFSFNFNAGIGLKPARRGTRPAPKARGRAREKKQRQPWDAAIKGPRRRIAVDAVFGGGSMGSARFWIFPVRDLLFVRAGVGVTVPSASPLLVNVPVTIATGIYPFPRRLRTVRLYTGVVDTVIAAEYLESVGVAPGGQNLGQRLWQNLGIMVGAEYNLSPHLGVSIEPSFYPFLAGRRSGEGSWMQLALAVRVM